jgi:hypothetical protein
MFCSGPGGRRFKSSLPVDFQSATSCCLAFTVVTQASRGLAARDYRESQRGALSDSRLRLGEVADRIVVRVGRIRSVWFLRISAIRLQSIPRFFMS